MQQATGRKLRRYLLPVFIVLSCVMFVMLYKEHSWNQSLVEREDYLSVKLEEGEVAFKNVLYLREKADGKLAELNKRFDESQTEIAKLTKTIDEKDGKNAKLEKLEEAKKQQEAAQAATTAPSEAATTKAAAA